MKRLTWMIPLIAVLVCMAGLAACNDEDSTDEDRDRAHLEKMEADIDTLIGEPTCKDGKECRTIAFGDKPCGGPWSYKIYSTSSVDTLALEQMIDVYNKFNQTLNERYGWMSDCTVAIRPGVECLDGRCVAIEPAETERIE